MISLRLNGQDVPFTSTTKLEAEYVSPLFNWENIVGRKVYDLSLPYSYAADKIFNFATDPQSEFSNAAIKAELMHGGDLLMEAYIKLLSATKTNGFKTYISENLNSVFGDYQNYLISQLPLGSEAVPSPLPSNPDFTTAKFCFPQIDNSAFYGETVPGTYGGYVNHYTGGAYTADSPKVPMIFLRWLIQQIGQLANIEITGEFLEDPAIQRVFLLNLYAINGASTITYANHLPDISVQSFFIELRKLFCLRYDFDVINRTLNISYLKNTLKQDCTLDFTAKSNPLHERINDTQNRLELSFTLDSNDALMKAIPTGFEKYQTPLTEINTAATFLTVNSAFSTAIMNGTNPQLKQVGTLPSANVTGAKVTPRLLFWSGLVSSVPSASNTYGSVSLTITGTNGIVNVFWKDFENWKSSTKPLQKFINLSANDVAILNKDLGQKIHIRGVNYYIQNLITPLPITSPSLANLLTA